MVVISLVFLFSIQPAFALSKTYDIPEDGSFTLNFRDINDLSPTPSPTITLDKSFYHLGDSGVITITDFNGNLDPTAIDTITATVGGNPVILTETALNSGIFSGPFTAGITNNVVYNSEPASAARAVVEVTFLGSGTVTISDVTYPNSFCIVDGSGQDAITQPIDIQLSGEDATVDQVTISYSNADLGGSSNEVIMMLFEPSGSNFAIVTAPFFPTVHETALDITDPNTVLTNQFESNLALFSGGLGVGDIIGSGQYALSRATGCIGGGSGGLIGAGVVLNALAGTVAGNTGTDVSPPSLVFSRPSPTGLKLTDALLGSLFAPDPFKPISPTTDSSITTPLRINDNGYFLTGYANTIEPEPVNTGEDVGLTLSFLEASLVQHVALHFVNENTGEMSDTDPMITFDNGNVIKSDPQGILGDEISFTTSKDGIHSIFNFGFSFDQPTQRHLMITAWDDKRNSANTKIFDAFDVSGEPVPQEESHLFLQDLGQYMITQDGVIDIQAQSNIIQQEPVVGFEYSDSIGRLDRHDMTLLYHTIGDEQKRASSVVADNFKLDTKTFVAHDEKKPYDTSKRAPELTWSSVGHKLRDFTKTPDQNKELLKQLCWQEHLKAEKILKSLSKTSHPDD